MPPALRALASAAGLTAVVVAAGLAIARPDERPSGPPVVASTPLADLDSTSVAVARRGFCDALAAAVVTEVLGDEPTSGTAYDNGDRVPVAPGVEDVVHEHGCTWQAADTRTAAAWVFAPPVTRERATELAAAAIRRRGCTPVAEAPPFGSPTVAVTCTRGAGTEATWHGLFGDAWLSCSLTLPADTPVEELLDRAGRWCVAVVHAAASTQPA